MKYAVHLRPIVSVRVVVEASAPEEAIKKAYHDTDFYSMFGDGDISWAEETDDVVLLDELDEKGQNVDDGGWWRCDHRDEWELEQHFIRR